MAMSAVTCAATPVIDLAVVTTSQQAAWSTGNYAVVGTTLQIVGEDLCEALDLRSGARVLDVAAGNGNATLAAARRWCDVTSTDYVPALLEDGRRRAAAERLSIKFKEADAEALPFEKESFDVVLSSFGVMFTPNHARSAGELLRVCRPGGKIGLANWTPRGFIGKLFGVIGRHVPPPRGLTPPSRWGVEDYVEQLFRASASDIHTTQRDFVFRYKSAQHWIDVFRTWYGPVHKAFASLPPEKQQQLNDDLHALIRDFNTSGDSTAVIPGEYLEVVVTKK